MKKYFLVFKLSLQDTLEYKFDFLMNTGKYALMVLLMALLWTAVEKVNPTPLFSQQETVAYFVFAAMLYSLSNFHTWYMEDDIRLGGLSKFLVKPVSTMGYYLSYQLGSVFLETILKIVIFFPLLSVFGFSLPTIPIISWVLILLFLPLIYIFSFYLITTISICTFWINEAYAVRWAFLSLTRLQSGVLVPIVFFPLWYQKIAIFLPFQHLAFTPIQIILNNISVQTALLSWITLLVWTISMFFFQNLLWKKGLYQYEGTGI